MELKQLISKFTYRIEAKPGGGFIARPSDPSAAQLEAPTREELQQKIRATIVESLGTQFPGLKPAMEGQPANLNFHIEHKPGGGYIVHSADAQSEPIEFGTHNDLESHLAEKFINFVGKRLAPELAQQLAAQGGSGDINVSVNKKVKFNINAGSHRLSFDVNRPAAPSPEPYGQSLSDGENTDSALTGSNNPANAPITPEPTSNWTMLLFIVLLATVGAILFILLHR